jgi:hypothetical protein
MTTPGARPAITRQPASDNCRRTRRCRLGPNTNNGTEINRISTAVDVDLRRAVQLRQAADVSVVDATVGQAAESATQPSSSRRTSTT